LAFVFRRQPLAGWVYQLLGLKMANVKTDRANLATVALLVCVLALTLLLAVFDTTANAASTVFGSTGRGPESIAVDSAGNVYTGNNTSMDVSRITAGGISTIRGSTGISPHGIAVGSNGNIYVVNANSHNVSKITPDGVSSILGPTGNTPLAIAIDPAGNIYTANGSSRTVSKLTPSGTSTTLGTTGSYPCAITIDLNGNIYTANQESNNVTKITPGGVSTTLGTTGSTPRGITVDRAGNIYTANADSNNVSKITPSGVTTTFGATGLTPNAITIDAIGNIYTSNQLSNTVTKITRGGVSSTLGSTGSYPLAIAVDSYGNVYTANYTANTVSKLTPSGISTTLGPTDSTPVATAIDSQGNLYTANWGSDNVSMLEPDGTSTILGDTGSHPYGITVGPDGNVYTANSGSNDVSMIEPDGTSTILGDTGTTPVAITVDPGGNIYTANSDSNDVSMIEPNGTSTILGDTGTTPAAITVDPDGNIYTANSDSNDVSMVEPDGTSTILGDTGTTPVGITIDSDGNIYTANYGSDDVSVIEPDGTSTILGTTGTTPYAITIDSAGNVYTANTDSSDVTKIEPDGTSTILAETGGGPEAITLDSEGNLYTANSDSNDVTKISSSSYPSPPSRPGAPTAVGQNRSATVAITPNDFSAIYGSPSGYTVSAVQDQTKSCTVRPPDLSCVVGGLDNGTAYSFQAQANLDSWQTAASTASNPVTPAATTPSAPTALIATPGNGSATIAFNAGSDNGSAIINYQYSVDSGVWTSLSPIDATSPITISGLTNGITYSIRLRAVNSAGSGLGTASAAVSVTPLGVPAAPTSLVATPGNGGASISFTAGSNNGSAISNYQYSVDGGEWIAISPAVTASPVAVTGLANGATYAIRLRAINNVGDGLGAASNPVSVTPLSVPSAPTSLVATPGNRSATIAFTAGSDNGSVITNYQYSLNSGSWIALSPAGSTSPITISGLTNGSVYSVRLRAINGAGDGLGAVSEPVTVTPAGVPSAPTSLVATPGNGSATIAFTAGSDNGSAITNYEYSLDSGSWIALSPTDSTSPITISGLTADISYSIRLRATNSAGSGLGVASAAVRVTPVGVPKAPRSLRATPSNGGASISFTAGSNNGSAISNYQYSVDGGGWIAISPADTTSPVAITGLANGATYSIRLRAINNVGDGLGAASEPVTVTPASVPDAPTALAAAFVDGDSLVIRFVAGAANGSPIINYQYSLNNGAWVSFNPPKTASPMTISRLSVGATYSVRLRAVNTAGDGLGVASSAISVTTSTPTPVSPVIRKPVVSWSSSKTARTVTALITPTTKVTYALTALTVRSGRVMKTGTCKPTTIARGKSRVKRISCTVKLSKGTWSTWVTPKLSGLLGPTNKTSFSFSK
jgi:titin